MTQDKRKSDVFPMVSGINKVIVIANLSLASAS